MTKKFWALNLAVLGSAALIDQLSKALLLRYDGIVWSLEHSFGSLVLQTSLNAQFAFSIPAPAQLILSVITIVFLFVLGLWVYLLIQRKKSAYWIALVLGGAVGNIIDRFVYGGVIDWIEIQISQWSWSSFNLADAFILVGIIGWFFASRSTESNQQLSNLE